MREAPGAATGAPGNGRTLLWWAGVVVLTAGVGVAATGVGPSPVPVKTVLRLLASPFFPEAASGIDDRVSYIVLHVRLSRVFLAFVVGAALALAGAVYQGVLLNPLADPFTLGVSTGAAFGASVAILLGWGTYSMLGFSGLPAAAFGGAVGALALVSALGRMDGAMQSTTLVLAGIIVSTFLSACVSLLKALNEDSVSSIVFWIMGSLSGKGWREVMVVVPHLAIGGAVVLAFARELDCLALGDVQAQHLGVNVRRVRVWLLLSASLATAAAVAVSGVIGFVGLVVPHLARMVLGPLHRRLLPAVAAAGGLLVLVSDTLARTVLPGGAELPVGVVTALLGGPFFCWLMLHRRARLAA